ncbi:MAG: CapA family protein, partial [Candidatus Moraniibacteriota bacterium]
TVITKNGIKVGFVGFHEFSYLNFDKVFAEIEKMRPQVDILIVSPHWGVEYESKPTEKQMKWAREFIDSGADAVVGSHSHVVGEDEEYNGKKIFYSLGNFAFDQYFSKRTMEGLAVYISVKKEGGKVTLSYAKIPLSISRKGVTISTSTVILLP